jgi:hypothetical protein
MPLQYHLIEALQALFAFEEENHAPVERKLTFGIWVVNQSGMVVILTVWKYPIRITLLIAM